MKKTAIIMNGLNEKDAKTAVNAVEASQLLMQDIYYLADSQSPVMACLIDGTFQSVGALHLKLVRLTESIYKELDLRTLVDDRKSAEYPQRTDDEKDFSATKNAERAARSANVLTEKLRDLILSDSPVIGDAAMTYLEEAARIRQVLDRLASAFKAGPYEPEEPVSGESVPVARTASKGRIRS